MDDELRESLVNRIGNLTLLEKKPNSTLRGDGISKKIVEYKNSTYQLTQQIEKTYQSVQQPRKGKWEKEEIDLRQTELAKLAVKAWSITV